MRKPVVEMTAVELLSEFNRNHEYHEAVALARHQLEDEEDIREDRHGQRFLPVKYVGRPTGEVREPKPEQDQRWAELCEEINKRFARKE